MRLERAKIVPRNGENGRNCIYILGHRVGSLQGVRCLKTHVQIIKDDHEMVIFVMMKEKPQQIKQKGVFVFVSRCGSIKEFKIIKTQCLSISFSIWGLHFISPSCTNFLAATGLHFISPAGRAVFSVHSQSNWNFKVASPWF